MSADSAGDDGTKHFPIHQSHKETMPNNNETFEENYNNNVDDDHKTDLTFESNDNDNRKYIFVNFYNSKILKLIFNSKSTEINGQNEQKPAKNKPPPLRVSIQF